MSRTIWFTADTHFGHANIMKYCNRPFNTVEDMDRAIIDNINKVVKPNDMLYHLGDWSWNSHEEYREAINCENITFIYGNHDKPIRQNRGMRERLFGRYGWHELLEITVGDQPLTLCYYAMRVWNKSHHGAWHLYGHSHGSLPDDPNSLSFDVGVDCHDYKPLSFDEVRQRMSTKTFVPIDHHRN